MNRPSPLPLSVWRTLLIAISRFGIHACAAGAIVLVVAAFLALGLLLGGLVSEDTLDVYMLGIVLGSLVIGLVLGAVGLVAHLLQQRAEFTVAYRLRGQWRPTARERARVTKTSMLSTLWTTLMIYAMFAGVLGFCLVIFVVFIERPSPFNGRFDFEDGFAIFTAVLVASVVLAVRGMVYITRTAKPRHEQRVEQMEAEWPSSGVPATRVAKGGQTPGRPTWLRWFERTAITLTTLGLLTVKTVQMFVKPSIHLPQRIDNPESVPILQLVTPIGSVLVAVGLVMLVIVAVISLVASFGEFRALRSAELSLTDQQAAHLLMRPHPVGELALYVLVVGLLVAGAGSTPVMVLGRESADLSAAVADFGLWWWPGVAILFLALVLEIVAARLKHRLDTAVHARYNVDPLPPLKSSSDD